MKGGVNMENVLDKALNKMLLDTKITTRNETIEEIRDIVECEAIISSDEKDLSKRIIRKLDEMKELRNLFHYE